MAAASKGETCEDGRVLGPSRILLACVAAVGGSLACGPSLQAIYEGNSHFEHCYALEENAQTKLGDKVDCWRDWSEHYTYGQTRDRILYATSRYVALSQSASTPTDEALMMAAPGMTRRESNITAPTPTNAFAPPPKVLEPSDASAPPAQPSEQALLLGAAADADARADAGALAAPQAALPAARCTDGCGDKFRDCRGKCGAPAAGASKPSPCGACDRTYRACMRACFK